MDMGIYEELVARGLIAQVTNEEEIREMINKGKATFYFVAFDNTVSAQFEAFDEKKILETFIGIGQKIEVGDFDPNLEHCAVCPFNTRCEKSCVSSQPSAETGKPE